MNSLYMDVENLATTYYYIFLPKNKNGNGTLCKNDKYHGLIFKAVLIKLFLLFVSFTETLAVTANINGWA